MKITKQLLTNPRTRPALRDRNRYLLREVRGIVLHWTANTKKGAGAAAHRKYFNTTDRAASAHYIIEEEIIIQCIPSDEVAWRKFVYRFSCNW